MRKVWLLIISLALLAALLVACDKGADTPVPDNNPPAHEHTVVIDNAVPATCKEAGFTAGAHCSECGVILVKSEAVAKLDHIVVVDEAVESTCDKAGLTAGAHCSECGDILVKQEVVASLKHTVVVDEAVESTCTKAGLTSGVHCSECGKIFKEQIEVSLKAHTYDDKYDAFCNVCGHERDAECAHTELETITGNPATCVVEGLTDGKKCTKCSEITVAQEIIPTNDDHSFENRICKDCGAIDYSSGLLYAKNSDGTCYIGSIGSCTDTEIYIPPYIDGYKVTGIGECAFLQCDSITSVIIPEGVTSIGVSAFAWCSRLTNVVIPEGVTSIGIAAFWECPFVSIVIPNSVTSIDTMAFEHCSNLTSIVIPDNVTTIESCVFRDCSSLVSVTIGKNVTSIGKGAFVRCSSLTSIYFEGTMEQWNDVVKGSDWNNNAGDYIVYCDDGMII